MEKNIMSDIKKLLGESVSEDTANALQAIIDKTVSDTEAKALALQTENKTLVESIETLKQKHEDDVKFLQEKADEFAEQARQEAIDESRVEIETLKEQAEAYGEFLIERANAFGEMLTEKHETEKATLIEKAESYGEFLIEKAESYGEVLIEKAEDYGEFLIEKAEDYGTVLIEKADEYGNSIEAKCLEEAKQEIESFKAEHLELFERLDEQSRMKTVFDNLKTLIESSGFTLEESSILDETQEELRTERKNSRRLKSTITEQASEIKELLIEKHISEFGEDLAFTDKERVKKAAIFTRCESGEDLKQVVKTLVENNLLNNKNNKNNNIIDESTKKDTDSKKSGWGSRVV